MGTEKYMSYLVDNGVCVDEARRCVVTAEEIVGAFSGVDREFLEETLDSCCFTGDIDGRACVVFEAARYVEGRPLSSLTKSSLSVAMKDLRDETDTVFGRKIGGSGIGMREGK